MGTLIGTDIVYALLVSFAQSVLARRVWSGAHVSECVFIISTVLLLYVKHQEMKRRSVEVVWLPMIAVVVGLLLMFRLTPNSPVWRRLLVLDERVAMVLLVPASFWWWPKKKRDYVRGARIQKVNLAAREAKSAIPRGDFGVEFLGVRLPTKMLRGNFLFVGSPGTGKTTTIRLLMQQLLPTIRTGTDRRAIIFDAKCEVLPHLDEMGVSCPCYVLNPFDARASAWDVAKDLRDKSMADTFVGSLVEDDPSPTANSTFFVKAARDLTAGVLSVMMDKYPTKWTLPDLIYVLDEPKRLIDAISSHPGTKCLVAKYCDYDPTFKSIFATLSEKLAHMRRVGALYRVAQSERPMFSFSQWMAGSSILVLGNDRTREEVLTPLNKLLFQIASKFLLRLNQVPSKTRQSFILLDELHQAGRLTGLADLLLTGREYGVSTVIGLQSRSALTKPGLYSPAEATFIAETCSTRIVLRCCDDTAEFASSSMIGDTISHEASVGTDGRFSWSQVQRRAVLPATIQNLSHLETEGVLEAICQSPVAGTWSVRIPAPRLFSRLKKSGSGQRRAYVERPASHQDESHLVCSEGLAKALGLTPEGESRPFVPRMIRTRRLGC